MTVNPDSPLSPVIQVVNAIRDKIDSGELAPQTKLDSSRVLAKEFRTSGTTINSAIRILREDRRVFTNQRGTFVAAKSEAEAEEPNLADQVAELATQLRVLADRVATLERKDAAHV